MDIVRIRDLLPQPELVEVSPGKMLELRALDLQQIIKLFLKYNEAFLVLYVEGQKAKPNYEMMLLATPDMVAEIIALSAQVPGQEEDVARMPGTVQLIALSAVWKLSVPDPKKLIESLSVVTDALRKPSPKATAPNEPLPETASNPA